MIAAASVTTAGLLTADRDSPGTTTPTNGIGILAASGRSVAAGFAVPTTPGDLVGGAGSVWLTSPEGQVVYRLDAHSHRLIQTISVGSGPEGLAYANGAVWVANALDGTVTRIDAATNRAVQTVGVGGEPTGVAFAYGSVWVTDPLSSTVIRIDPTSGRLIKSIGVPYPPLGIAFGAGSMWVTSEADDSVTRINPLSGVVEQRIGVGGGPDAISFGFGSAWVANRLDSTVSRIDPDNNAVDRTIPVGEGPSSVVIAPTAVWVAGGVSGSVSKIDPGRDVVVATVSVGNRPGAGAFVAGRLWVTLRPAAARGHRGGTLQLLSSAPFATIDPAASYPEVPPLFDASIFDTLVTFQRVGGTEGERLVPDLALAIPTPKDSGTSYTFELRPGLRYSTGERVHPEDFRHGLERVFALNPAARSFFTDLLGASNCSGVTPCDLSRAVVIDDARDTVEFHLSTADSDFLDKLAFAFTAPVPKSVPSLDRGATPVPSTGPYKITHFVPGRKIEMARNPYFHEWSRAAQPDGYPDAMVWSFGRSIGDEVSAIETGHADWAVDNPPDVAAVEAQYAGQVHINPLPGIAYAAFNVTVPPFNDERVRHAVSLAADRNAAVQALGGIDSAQPTCQILPPNLAGYRPYCPFTVNRGSGKWIGPDVAQAARLITQSHTSGMRVVVWGHHGDDALGKFFVSLLNSLGYRATLHLSDDADVAANINDSRKHVQASIGEWIADYPSASDFFDLFFRCSAFRLGDPNDTRSSLFYCRPNIDQLMNEADASKVSDPSASAAKWAYVDRLVTDDAPWVPFASLRFADLISARARNYEYSPVWGLLVDQLWIR